MTGRSAARIRRATPLLDMKFFCLCMSPAIDATVSLPRAPQGTGEVFKNVEEVENVGGKAVNVARWLALRGATVACGGLLGVENDGPFVRELASYGAEDRFVRVAGATRRNEMVVWPGGSMKLNRAAFPALERGFDAAPALARADEPADETDAEGNLKVAILSGSLPPAVPADFYADAVTRLKRRGWFVALDASGEPLVRGVEAGPDLVKPNAEECAPLVGFIPKTPEDFARATRLLREKAAHAVVSDGGSGAWFDGDFVAAPNVDVVDTTAAGDTLLAEYCWRVFAAGGFDAARPALRDAAEWAVAAGSAACTMPGGAPPPAALVARLRERLAETGAHEDGAGDAGAARCAENLEKL